MSIYFLIYHNIVRRLESARISLFSGAACTRYPWRPSPSPSAKRVARGGAVSGQNGNDTACAGTAQILLSSCPDAVTGVAGCWIVSLSRARACRREALPFLLPLPPNHVLRRRRRRRCRPRRRRRRRRLRRRHRHHHHHHHHHHYHHHRRSCSITASRSLTRLDRQEKTPEKRKADDGREGFLLPT